MDNEVIKSWKAYGYHNHFCMRNGFLCCVGRFLYTWGVLVDIDMEGCWGRFCFDTQANAVLFLKEWNGYTFPVVGEDGCTAIKDGACELPKPDPIDVESPN